MYGKVNLEPVPWTDAQLAAAEAARAEARTLAEKYLAIKGAANYEERVALLAEDCMYEQVFTMDNFPERTCGREKVRRRFAELAKVYDEWEYNNIRLIEVDKPNVVLVECDVDATITNPMFKKELSPRHYHSYYYIMFVVRDGEILQLRQFTNPQKLVHDFWKDLPNSCG